MQVELSVGLVVLALCWVSGVRAVRRLQQPDPGSRTVRLVAVQPNVPQLKKWPPAYAAEIYQRLEDGMAPVQLFTQGLDLVVWPETAVPGYLPVDVETDLFISGLARAGGVPILVGAMEVEPGTERLYNSSFLYGADGRVKERYRKIHLVPFGEYLPLAREIPWLRRFEPLGFSCTPGTTNTVFTVPAGGRGAVPFSALICFEDVFAPVARGMVRAGARFLVNQTNDAWFDGTAGPVQHLSHCVFRCVENRVPCVRAGNSGVTCFIDRTGRIDETTRDVLARGEWQHVRYRTGALSAPSPQMPLTFYCRYGDLPFGLPCGIMAALLLAHGAWRDWKRRRRMLRPAATQGDVEK
jgi:apolipoprotein N-acyltransferase